MTMAAQDVRQQMHQVYEFILRHKETNDGAPPPYRLIARMCDLSSTSVAADRVKRLAVKGRLAFCGGKICVVGARWLRPGVKVIEVDRATALLDRAIGEVLHA